MGDLNPYKAPLAEQKKPASQFEWPWRLMLAAICLIIALHRTVHPEDWGTTGVSYLWLEVRRSQAAQEIPFLVVTSWLGCTSLVYEKRKMIKAVSFLLLSVGLFRLVDAIKFCL